MGAPGAPGTGNDMAISAEAARNGKAGLRIRIGSQQTPNRQGILPTTIPAGASRVTLRFSMKVHDSVSVARVPNLAGGIGQSLQIGLELEQLALKLVSQKSSLPSSSPVATLEPGKWTTITLDIDFVALKATATAVAEKGTVEQGSIDMGPQWGGWDKETLFVRFGASFLVSGASANLSFDDVALTKE